MLEFVLSSIGASILLTVALNVIIRAFPGTSADARARQVVGETSARPDEMPSTEDTTRLRIYFPWKQILYWSILIGMVQALVRFVN